MNPQESKQLQEVDRLLQKINEVFETRIIPNLEKHNENVEKVLQDTAVLSTLAPAEIVHQVKLERNILPALDFPEITSVFIRSPTKRSLTRLEIPMLGNNIRDSRKKPLVENMKLPELVTRLYDGAVPGSS